MLGCWCGGNTSFFSVPRPLPLCPPSPPNAQDKPLEQRLLPPWPLLLALEGEGVPCAALLAFCLEGDNRPDAHALAGAAAGVLGLQQAGRAQADGPPVGEAAPASASVGLTWLPPASWQHAFGSASRPLLY